VQPLNPATERALFSPFRAWIILGITTIIGAALRLHLLSARSIWIDEGASISFATLPWGAFLRTLWSYQGNMALYYFLLRPWIHLGDSEFAVRSLSVLFGVLTIPAIYFLGTRLFDRATGLTAATLLSVHAFHIHWSQEARGYTLLTLLLVVAAYFLVCALESSEHKGYWGYWIAFTVTAALSFYAHIFAVFVLAAFALSIAFPKPFRVRISTVVVIAILFEHLIAPMALFVLMNRSGNQLSWLPRPSLPEIWEFLILLTGQGGVLLLALYLFLAGLVFMRPAGMIERDGDKQWDKEKWVVRLLVLWLLLPPLLTLAATPVKLLFYPRYMVMCVPAMVLLAARGLTRWYHAPLARRWAGASALVVVLMLSGWGTYRYFANLAQESTDWRSAVNYILEHQQPGDGVLIYRAHALCYRYYTHRSESEHRFVSAPDVVYPVADATRLVSREEIGADIAGHERIWLLLHSENDKPDELAVVRAVLAGNFQRQGERAFPGEIPITVTLYGR
jgi:mannosyltransferase